MKVLALIDNSIYNGLDKENTGYAEQTFKKVTEKAEKLAEACLVAGPEQKGRSAGRDFFTWLADKAAGYDAVLYLFADEPFIDMELARKMLENHERYLADYSFAEGYPGGLAPQVISTAVLPALADLAEKKAAEAGRSFIFELIKRDINEFEIETEISALDLRSERIELNMAAKNNRIICKKILQAAGDEGAGSIMEIIDTRKELLWGCPVYYNFQITTESGQHTLYQPQTPFCHERFMDFALFAAALEKIDRFSEEAVIGLAYLGDPSQHPQFSLFINEVAKYKKMRLHIETSGAFWSSVDWQSLLNFDRERLSLIILLDTLKEEVYRKIHGEGFAQAQAFTERALSELKDNTYIQTMRINALEEELESFYRHFSAKTGNVIIQKYNSYCGALPDDMVIDIAPLKRNVCWALKRELTVRVDGTVFLCRQDVGNTVSLGNLFHKEPEEIWSAAEEYRLRHVKADYPELCKKCDEYYIFNF
jgi:spiro-SPASM protein